MFDAIQEFDKALEIKQDFALAYLNKALVYNILNGEENARKAIELLDLAIECNDRYYDAYFNKGCILKKLGEYEEAMENFNKCREIKGSQYDEESEKRIKECALVLKNNVTNQKNIIEETEKEYSKG